VLLLLYSGIDSCCLQVWYLLGLLNYLRGSDFKYNARYYLKKGLQVESFSFLFYYSLSVSFFLCRDKVLGFLKKSKILYKICHNC